MAHDTFKKPIDWSALFAEWCESGLSKSDFLKTKKINPRSMIARRKTQGWVLDIDAARRHMKKVMKDGEIDRALAEVRDESEMAERHLDEKSPRVAINEIWQIVQGWRQRQAENDYKMADVIRLHAKVILKNTLTTKTDASGNQTVETSLKPSELLSLARVSETIQKVQRLALGLSTENIGVDNMAASDEGDAVPVFEVQVNENGKFVNIR